MTELRIPLTEDEYRRAILVKDALNVTWRDLFVLALAKLGQINADDVLSNIDKSIELLKSQARDDKVAMLDLTKILIRLIVNDNYVNAYNVSSKLNDYIRKQLEAGVKDE